MDPQAQLHCCLVIAIVLLCSLFIDISFGSKCAIVDFERPAAVSITHQSSDGAEIRGYVDVRKDAFLFWSYYKSPYRVALSSPGKQQPWPTVFYAALGAASRLGHGNFSGIGAVNLTWPHSADLLVVDTPVGTGNSYEEATSSNKWRRGWGTPFLQEAADIFVLLRALSMEIETLQRSPLILLPSSTDAGTGTGAYNGRIGTVVGLAIRAGALTNLTLPSGDAGGLVERFDGRTTPEQDKIIDTRPRVCVAAPP